MHLERSLRWFWQLLTWYSHIQVAVDYFWNPPNFPKRSCGHHTPARPSFWPGLEFEWDCCLPHFYFRIYPGQTIHFWTGQVPNVPKLSPECVHARTPRRYRRSEHPTPQFNMGVYGDSNFEGAPRAGYSMSRGPVRFSGHLEASPVQIEWRKWG